MSLYALPVSSSDLTALQQGIQFTTDTGEANTQADAIKNGSTTVFAYAQSLLGKSVSTSQVAMADFAYALGKTDTVSHLGGITTGFLPPQVKFAVDNSLAGGPTVFAAQVYALALATSFSDFRTTLDSQNFVQTTATLTGTNASAIQNFFNVWLAFYSANPTAAPGLTANQAAAASAWGDAMGTALDRGPNDTGPGIDAARAIQNAVANALYDNAQTSSSPPGAKYAEGVAIGSLPTHTEFQGEVRLTTGVDIVVLNQSNSTVIGTFGDAGQTWTLGDTITAAAGTTGQVFNLTGIAAAGSVINVTSVGPGNTVSGVQTANVSAAGQAVQGDFTATGPEGAWTGLTRLTVASGGSTLGFAVDRLTVAATTAVQLTDTLVSTTIDPLTVNGSLTTTITENNGTFGNGGITVNGTNGTTSVSVTQTEAVAGNHGIVKIVDANGADKTAAGTITKITLDGLSHFADFTTGPNLIIDNALTNLTVNHSDLNLKDGLVGLAIIDNLTTPTATTLTLSLGADGVNAAGEAVTQLVLAVPKAQYSTIHLSLGAQNSFVNIIDNGLTRLDTPSAGTGALVGTPDLPSFINSKVDAAVNFDFSGLNGPNNIEVNRNDENANGPNKADVYALGNFGTNFKSPTTVQQLTIDNNNPANTDTINFGSGAYIIKDAPHPAGTHSYVQTAANGAGLANPSTASQWATIINLHGGPNSDTLTFATDKVQTSVKSGAVDSIAMGIANALATAAHTAVEFEFGGNTYIFDHADNSASLTAADAMVQLVGIHPIAAVSAANAITFIS